MIIENHGKEIYEYLIRDTNTVITLHPEKSIYIDPKKFTQDNYEWIFDIFLTDEMNKNGIIIFGDIEEFPIGKNPNKKESMKKINNKKKSRFENMDI